MRGVDEELHLLLVHQAARATTVGDGGASQYQQEQQGIEQASQRGAIPRSLYRHLNQFRGRVGAVGQCSHLYIVGAGLQLAQRDGVRAVVGVQPRSFVDAIFEGNVRGVGEVQLREHQRECVVAIRQPELVAQRYRLLRDAHAVELRKRVHRHTFHDEIREQQGVGLLLHRLDGGGHERGQTIVGAEEDAVALCVQAHPIEVFAVVQAVAVHVADEAVLLAVVLPDAHRRGTPEVAVGGLHDVADGLVAQLFAAGVGGHLSRLTVVEVQTLLRADGNIAVAQLAQREAHRAVQQLVPAVRVEVVGLRVVARHSRRRAQPDESVAVALHAHHPVVAEEAAHGVAVRNAVVAQLMRQRVVAAEAA